MPAQNSFDPQGEQGEYVHADGRLTSDPRFLQASGATLAAEAYLGGIDRSSQATALYEFLFTVRQFDDAAQARNDPAAAGPAACAARPNAKARGRCRPAGPVEAPALRSHARPV